MSTINDYKSYHQYLKEYSTWRENKNIQQAKRQEYLRRNPDVIKDYDLQRAKILLSAVDFMDKSVIDNSDNVGTAFETAANLGLGYAALGGTAVGLIIKKMKFFEKFINKIVQKHPKSKNIISTGITVSFGVLGIIAAYPIYSILSKFQTKINRKRRFETMENELQDPRIFVVLDEGQKQIFKENIEEIKNNKSKNKINIAEKNIKSLKQIANETLHYEKEQNYFKEKYKENKEFYEEDLTEKEIKNAKKDKILLLTLIKEINSKSQSYTEKIERITNNLIAISFALSSLFTLIYERIAKKIKLKSSSIPAGLGVALFVGSTFFAKWSQKQAAQIGRFKAKQELINNPENLVYISNSKTNSINDEEIELKPIKKNKTKPIKFLKEFFKDNKEYKEWQKTKNLTARDICQAMEGIEISQEQIKDGKRLQKNMFKTFYKIDRNTQNYSGQIDVASETLKYPLTLIFGTLGSVLGMKHLASLRTAVSSKEILKHTIKYIGTISLFTAPTMVVNAYFANMKKMSSRICDMLTMKDLEDYRFFADYSRFEKGNKEIG